MKYEFEQQLLSFIIGMLAVFLLGMLCSGCALISAIDECKYQTYEENTCTEVKDESSEFDDDGSWVDFEDVTDAQ